MRSPADRTRRALLNPRKRRAAPLAEEFARKVASYTAGGPQKLFERLAGTSGRAAVGHELPPP
jgi:hypothetical protein